MMKKFGSMALVVGLGLLGGSRTLLAEKTPKQTTEQASTVVSPDMKATMTSYVDVSSALARDQLEDAKKAAAATADAAKRAANHQQDETKGLLAKVGQSASRLAGAVDLEAARKEFRDLSENVIGMVKVGPDLQDGYEIFRCPMAKGYNQWMQAAGEARNPYYGSAMVTCGLKVKEI